MWERNLLKIPVILQKLHGFDFKPLHGNLIFLFILGVYLCGSIPFLFEEKETGYDFRLRIAHLSNWGIGNFTSDFRHAGSYIPLEISEYVFHNYNVIPLISSGILLALVYLVSFKMTGKYYPSIIAVLFLLSSNVFRHYDVGPAYPNFWLDLYFFSLYLMYKKWQLSWLSYALSIPAKAITILYVPINLAFAQWADIKHNRTEVVLTYLGLIVAGIVLFKLFDPIKVAISFDVVNFLWGLGMWAFQYRSDKWIAILIPLILILLFFARRNKINNSGICLFMIFWMMIASPLLEGFTSYNNQEYRYIPMTIFIGISIAVLITWKKRLTNVSQMSKWE